MKKIEKYAIQIMAAMLANEGTMQQYTKEFSNLKGKKPTFGFFLGEIAFGMASGMIAAGEIIESEYPEIFED